MQAAVFKRVGSAAELRRLELELLAAPVSSTSPARTAAELEGLMRNDVHYNDVPGVWVMEAVDWKVSSCRLGTHLWCFQAHCEACDSCIKRQNFGKQMMSDRLHGPD